MDTSLFREFFAYMWLDRGDNSKCKVPSLLWFAHFAMRLCGGAPLLSCSHVVYHTSTCLLSKWIRLVKGLFGYKTWHFFASPPAIVITKIFRGLFILIFPFNSFSPMFQGPRDKTHLNLKNCAWKFHNQCWVKGTQTNSFISLEINIGTCRSLKVWHFICKYSVRGGFHR